MLCRNKYTDIYYSYIYVDSIIESCDMVIFQFMNCSIIYFKLFRTGIFYTYKKSLVSFIIQVTKIFHGDFSYNKFLYIYNIYDNKCINMKTESHLDEAVTSVMVRCILT